MNLKIQISVLFILLLFSEAFASQWIQRAGLPNVGRHRGTGISIGTKGYIGLGHFNGAGPNIILNDWWEYDPATNAWTQKANYIGNFGIGSYGVLSFGMEKVGFVGGGQVGSTGEFYKYDPSTNQWTPAMNTPTYAGNIAGFAIGNKGYYLSGNQLFEYDEALNIWVAKNFAPFSAGIWTCAFIIDGKAYYKTGTQLWEYKPSIDQWASRASYPGLATAGSVALTQNNKGYVVTGYSGGLSQVTKDVYEYNPGTNTWDSLPSFTGTARRFSSGFSIGNRAYIGTGTNGTNFADFWEFDALAGLEEMFDIGQFSCYPNPAIDKVNFKSENLNGFKIEVYDQTGSLVDSEESNNNSLNIFRKDKISGTYFYKVVHKNKAVHSGKFIFI